MFLFLQAVDQASVGAVPVVDAGISTTVDALAHQAGLVSITVWVLQALKNSKFFPYLSANTETATRIVSTIAAFLGAVAVQISVTGDAASGWHGTFAIPNAHVLWDSVIRFCGSKMGQEVLYTLLYKESAPRPVDVVSTLNDAKPIV